MSDILIKNMEIPKDYKYVDVRIFRDGTATTSSAEHPFYIRMDVIEVPPHGRLIDARMLREKSYRHYEGFMKGKIDGRTALLNIEKEIIDAPTIIPAEKEE